MKIEAVDLFYLAMPLIVSLPGLRARGPRARLLWMAALSCLAATLIGRLGPSAINAARKMIFHNQWYVVRNGCRLLGEIKDLGHDRVP